MNSQTDKQTKKRYGFWLRRVLFFSGFLFWTINQRPRPTNTKPKKTNAIQNKGLPSVKVKNMKSQNQFVQLKIYILL
jgi:hypothetical protein